MSVDRRTRSDGDTDEVDVVGLFEEQLPTAFEDAAERLLPATAARAGGSVLRPLHVAVDGRAWRLSIDAGTVRVDPADPASTPVLRLDAEQVHDLVVDQATPIAWLASGALDLEGAGLALVLGWWLLLRAALDGTTPHVAGAISLVDAAGDPLDLGRTFAPDDPVDEMSHFLHEVGFLRISGLFTEGEMAVVSADMDEAAPSHSQGDGRSWWATLADGTEALVRMQGFDERSAAAADLLTDDRLLGLAGLTGDGHRLAGSDNRIEGLFKPLGVARGISDIPWHKDCSLGRHSYDCCSLTAGISVTGADARSGQLRAVAGSHRALVWPAPSLQPGLDLPVVDLPTRTGDVTLHLSCALHMAQPPVVRERRVLYTTMTLPTLDTDARRRARARRDAVREAAPVTVSQPAFG